MPNPLFSRYSQGENRVTASILAVFERISFALVERILQILCETPEQSLLTIKNQIRLGKDAESIPDGVIQASFSYLLETKVVPGTVDLKQLKSHLKCLEAIPDATQKKLIVLTPDYEKPSVIEQLNSDLVVWTNFNTLHNAIADILTMDEAWLTSSFSLVSEQDRFLLKELVQMFLAEGLLNNGPSDSVLIIPARAAIHDYLNYSVYLCQPNRSFQRVEYLGFYHEGSIDRRIAKILFPPINEIELTEEGIEVAKSKENIDQVVVDLLQDLVRRLEQDQSQRYRDTMKVFFLSSHTLEDKETIHLNQDIKNDLRNSNNRPYAFTQGQRYVSLAALQKNPRTTTELLTT